MPEDEPDWRTYTPPEPEYLLIMTVEQDGQWIQEIKMGRSEYLALKNHLAELRYPIADPQQQLCQILRLQVLQKVILQLRDVVDTMETLPGRKAQQHATEVLKEIQTALVNLGSSTK